MSKQVDERVVSMQFDNKNFEKNVSTTMSTLDKLKQKLNFNGASKGLENINSAAKNIDLSGLSNGVAALEKRFSTMGIVGMTAIQNLTTSAMRLGSKLTSWFSGGIVQGGINRAMNLEKARFQLQGLLKDADKVEAVMKNVNASVDGTAYSLDQAAVVASQFAATGMQAGEKMEGALRAVAGTAAMTSADYQRVGLIFTQISGQGRVMGNDLLQLSNLGINAAATLATHFGITESEIRDMVSKGKVSFEMFAEAMDSAFGEHAAKANATFTGAMSNVRAALARIGAEFVSPLLVENGPLVKFFNTLREKINDVKKVIGPIASTFTKFATSVIDGATKIISKIDFSKPLKIFQGLELGFSKIGETIKTVAAPVEKVTESLKDLGDIVDKVIIGNFGNGEERLKALTEAGYNYYEIQNKVNETLGSSFRYTQEEIKAQDKLLGVQEKATETQKELSESDSERIAKLTELSDAELKNAGYTEEQIKALKQVKKEADKLGMPVQEFIDKIDELDGKTLIVESFKNIAKGLGAALTSIKDAWLNVFPPKSMEEKQQGLYDIVAAFHKFSTAFKTASEEADKEGSTINKLKRTFEGLFTAVKMVSTIIGGPIKIAFKILSKILGMCDIDILSVTAAIGDAIVGFDKWISSTFNFTKVFENIASGVKTAVKAIQDWFNSLKNSKNLPKDIADGIMSGLKFVWDGITDFIGNIGSSISNGFKGIPDNIISGFVNGIRNGIQIAWQVMVELGSQILSKFREVLGIHSPSTETKSDGENFVLGFINGVKEFASKAWDCIKDFASKCIEIVKNIDWGGIFAGVISVGLLALVKKIADALEVLAAPFSGLGSIFSSVGNLIKKSTKNVKKILKNTAKVVKSFSKVLNGIAFDMKAEGIKKLAISIAILVACIIALTYYKPEQLWQSVAVVAALAGVLVILSIAVEKMSKASVTIDKDGAKFNNVGRSMLGIAASLLLVAIAVKQMGSMSNEQIIKGLAGIFAIIIGLGLIMKAYGTFVKGKSAQNIDKAGSTILKIGATMLLLAIVTKIIGSMSGTEIAKGLIVITYFGGIITGLIAATKLAGNKIDKVGSTILKIGAAMLLMAVVVRTIGGMSVGSLVKGLVAITYFGGIITGLIAATKLAGNAFTLDLIGKTILEIGAAMLLMGVTARLMGGVPWGVMAKGLAAVTYLGGIITGLIAATRLAGGNDLTGVGATILMASISIGILGGIAALLGMMSVENLAKGIIAVGILGEIMGNLIRATRGAKECKGNLIVMTVAIAVMAAAVAGLSFIETSKLAGATAAMSVLMIVFGLMAKLTGMAKLDKKSIAPLIVMVGVIAVLAGILTLLSQLPVESSLGNAIALSTLMIALSGSLFILSKMGKIDKNVAKGIIALTLMAAPLLAFVGVLAVASLVPNATQNAILLAGLATVLTGLLAALALIGQFLTGGILPGIIGLTLMAVPLLAFVGVLAVMQCIGDATKNVLLLSKLMITLTACLVVVSSVGPLALIGVAAMTALTALMVAVGALAVGIGALMEKFPQLEEFLDTGIPILEKLSYAIGSMVGNLIAGFSDALMSTLPKLGLCLTQFMVNATPFIAGVKKIDQSVADGVKTLSLAVLALTAADLIAGIASFLQNGSSFADLGTELSKFMMNATPFIAGAKMLDPTAMEGVKALAQTILILTASDVLDALTSWLTGGSSFADFGAQLKPFGEGISDFAESVSGIDESSLNAMKVSAEAGKTLAEMAKTLPNSGGLLGKIFGENDMDTFGEQLSSFGDALVAYGDSVANLNVEAVNNSVEPSKALSDIGNNLPRQDGVWQVFSGENKMSVFGFELSSYGLALKAYGDSVAQLNVKAVNDSIPCSEALSDIGNNLPDTGGVWTKFNGDNDMKTFGTNLEAFGDSLVAYGDSVAKLKVEAVNDSVSAAKALTEIANSVPESGGWFSSDNFKTFGDNLKTFGEKMVDYSEKISEITDLSSLSTATSEFVNIANMVSGIAGIDFSGLKSFGESLGSIGSNAVSDFIKAFTGSYDKVKTAGSDMMAKVIEGVNSKDGDIKSAFALTASSGLGSIKSYYTDFRDAGIYLGEGLVIGINAKKIDAYNAGYALGKQAVQGEKDGQKSKSPSKLTIQAGKWLGEGLIIGMESFGTKVYKSGHELGETSVKSISSAISKISNALDSDMDCQPTIRPVMDLDDIYSGVNTMNSMLNLQPSVGTMSSLGSINHMMNQRIQNGANEEVVSAIDKLRKNLGNIGGNTYNINGITYDDGSNVSEAISSLIRAARVERRS